MVESFNLVKLVGPIAEIVYNEGTSPKPYVAGEVKIKTADDNIIPVSFYQSETTKAGKENKIYNSIMTVISEFKTITKDGIENADIISVGGASLEENSYYDQCNQLVRGFRVSSPFYNRKAGAESENEFVVEGTVLNIVEEINDDVPTGRVFVDLLVVGYGDRGNVLRLTVEDERGASYIKTSISQMDEVKFAGEIIFSETRKEIKEETAFGSPIVRVINTLERKLLIRSATAARQSTVSQEEIETVLADREGRLKAQKEKRDRKNSSTTSAKKEAPARGNFTL